MKPHSATHLVRKSELLSLRLADVHHAIVSCERCSRLRSYCRQVATEKKRAHREDTYWGRPVPGFGDQAARLLLVGLAPAAHGANRTGRVFTGDGSGDFLMSALHRTGFANIKTSQRVDDGLLLTDAYILAAVRCAPPGNKPLPEEITRCLDHLDAEVAQLSHLRVVVALGKIAFDAWLQLLRRRGTVMSPRPSFGHGVVVRTNPILIGCYHPSRQNTNTGKLTARMMEDVFRKARRLIALSLLVAAVFVASALPTGAQSKYPKRVVMLATHSSPGGGSDVFLREMAPHLSRIMGVTVIVENIQGGSGARAMAAIAKAKPDGGLFYATTPTFVYTSLLSKPATSYTDLEPLVNIFYDPEVLYTAADSSFKTLQEVVDRARKGGGRWGAANPASLERQALERLKQKAGVRPAIATFEGGGDMLINVLNHTLDMGIGEVQEIRAQFDARKLRLLGVVGDGRLVQFPDLKTVKEQGIDLSVQKFRGLAGPKGTPRDIIAFWEAAVPKLLADPEYKKIYSRNNLQPGFLAQTEYAKFMNEFGRETTVFLKESGVIK